MANTSTKSVADMHFVRLSVDLKAGAYRPKQAQWFMDGVAIGAAVSYPYTLEMRLPVDGKRHTFSISPIGSGASAGPQGLASTKVGSASADSLSPICGAHDGKGEVLARAVALRCAGADASSQGDHDMREVSLEFDSNLPDRVFGEWFRNGKSIGGVWSDQQPKLDRCPIDPQSTTVTYGLINHGQTVPKMLSGISHSAVPAGVPGLASLPPKFDDQVQVEVLGCAIEIVVEAHEFVACDFESKGTYEFTVRIDGDHESGTIRSDNPDVEIAVGGVAPGKVTALLPGVRVNRDLQLTAAQDPRVEEVSNFSFVSEVCGKWPIEIDATQTSPNTGCLAHASPIGDLNKSHYQDLSSSHFVTTTVASRVKAAPSVPLKHPISPNLNLNLNISEIRQRLDDRSFWSGILDNSLHPVPGGSYKQNLYFTNGVITPYQKAVKLAGVVGEFYDSDVRLVYNELELPAQLQAFIHTIESTDFRSLVPFAGVSLQDLIIPGAMARNFVEDVKVLDSLFAAAGNVASWAPNAIHWANDQSEAAETAWDYAWTQNVPSFPGFGGSAYDERLGKTDNGAIEALAYLAILYLAWRDGSRVGIVGTSHGSLVTAKAVMAFGYAFPMAIPWMQRNVRMAHSGCVLHRNRYPLLEELLDEYEAHADPWDPFATIFGGHDRTELKRYYERRFKGTRSLASTQLEGLDDPLNAARTSPQDMHSWFMGQWIPFMASPTAPLNAVTAPLNIFVGWKQDTRDERDLAVHRFKEYGAIVGMSHHHSIEKNYFLLKGSDRHFSKKNFFS